MSHKPQEYVTNKRSCGSVDSMNSGIYCIFGIVHCIFSGIYRTLHILLYLETYSVYNISYLANEL